jgi:hypothetical protein
MKTYNGYAIQESNTQLIAAAPDMLEALIEISGRIVSSNADKYTIQRAFDDISQIANKAIEKAGGKV